MGYRLNCLDKPVFRAVPKPLHTKFGIHYRLESCDRQFEIFAATYCGSLALQKLNLLESFDLGEIFVVTKLFY